MAKNKHPIFRMHKIEIHPNRWLVWAVAYMVFVAIALVGYISISNINFDTDVLVAENKYQPWRNYSNRELGFSLRYPGEWSIEAQSHTSVDFVPSDPFRPEVNLTVYSESEERDIRRALNIVSEKESELGGEPAVEIVNRITAGTAVETVLITSHNKKLYVFRGQSSSVRYFAQAFSFLNE